MDDQEPGSVGEELGRLPEGHYPYGVMPKPDVERAGNFSLARLIALATLAVVIAAAVFLLLTQLANGAL